MIPLQVPPRASREDSQEVSRKCSSGGSTRVLSGGYSRGPSGGHSGRYHRWCQRHQQHTPPQVPASTIENRPLSDPSRSKPVYWRTPKPSIGIRWRRVERG